MLLQNGMNMIIQKSWYNKTKVQEDGITHIVETEEYPMYILELQKLYKTQASKEEVIEQIILDLESAIEQLKRMKQKEENVKGESNEQGR